MSLAQNNGSTDYWLGNIINASKSVFGNKDPVYADRWNNVWRTLVMQSRDFTKQGAASDWGLSAKYLENTTESLSARFRQLQGRVFDTTDQGKTLRAVIATLQDLGYGIEKVEATAGTATGRKLDALQVTVTVFPRGERQMVVRANAVVTTEAASSQVDAPQFYQQYFFEPLSKALFLAANQDDGGPTASPQEPASLATEKPKEAK